MEYADNSAMSNGLRNFIPRAPRYVLRPNDERFLRFAHHDDRSNSYATRFLNLSETGLAFVIDRDTAPQIGDIIKIEFPVPGDGQVAWFARVIRIEEYVAEKSWHRRLDQSLDDYVVVGVRFHDLPVGHQNAIRAALNHKFNAILRERYRENFYQFSSFLAAHFWKSVVYLALAITTFLILYFFSLPSANYDQDHGAPWGQRFPALNFFSEKKGNE